ncbi:MAG: hypothetical protein E7004_00540 [Alphaproteobacteria bacterium]|nr:hypothetical protein [Alphaproteobacteria bacterium]
MENTITLTTGQKIEVLMQDEVTLDIDCSLRYIESGKKEIETYVEDISKQRLNSIVEDAKLQMDKQIEAGVVEAQEKAAISAKEIIDENISSMKSEIDNYINNDIKPEIEGAKSEAIKSADTAVEAANSALSSYNGLKSSLELAQEVASGNIGDIKYTLRNTEPYGGVFCNGQILTEEQYPDLYQMLLDDRLEKVSLTEYESQVTLTGACNFFAIDEINQTIKVPTITSETPDKRAYVVCYTGKDIEIDITQEIALNNPFSLLDYKWSEYELNNASWLLSNGAFHSGAIYVSVYELLLNIYNGTQTKEGVSVKLSTEEYTDTDFVINTADTTFRLPIKVKLASGNMIVGNGKQGIGVTTGNNDFALYNSASATTGIGSYAGFQDVGTAGHTVSGGENKVLGITTDPLKSGIETSAQGLYLYFYVGETIQDANLISASGVFTALSNKVGFDDKETIIGWGMPDYSAEIALTSGSNPHQLGYVMFVGNDVQNGYALGYIDGVQVFRFGSNGYQAGETAGMYLVNELNTITTERATIKFYPLKGVN